MGYIYLASPYTAGGANGFLREWRYLQAMEHMAWLLRRGIHVYSPIVHCHELAKTADLPKTAGFWKKYNFAMLGASDGVQVLRLEGWLLSGGIAEEVAEARRIQIPVAYVEPCSE